MKVTNLSPKNKAELVESFHQENHGSSKKSKISPFFCLFQSLSRLFRNRSHLLFHSIRTESILKTRMLSRLGSIKLKQIMRGLILKKLEISLNLIDQKTRPRIEIWDDEETESVFHDPHFEEQLPLTVHEIVAQFLEREKDNLIGEKGKELIAILNRFLQNKPQKVSVAKKNIPPPPPVKKKPPPPPPLKKKSHHLLHENQKRVFNQYKFLNTRQRF